MILIISIACAVVSVLCVVLNICYVKTFEIQGQTVIDAIKKLDEVTGTAIEQYESEHPDDFEPPPQPPA